MEFSLKINGEFRDFRVKNPAEAAELVKLLTASHGGHQEVTQRVGSESQNSAAQDIDDDNVFGETEQFGTIRGLLSSLRGTKTARFVKTLAHLDGHGGTDAVIKSSMSDDGDVNLAPFIASISKACKRSGVDMDSVLIRKEKRIRAGKVLYYYKLTDEAADFVKSIPDFEVDEDFGITPGDPESVEQGEPEQQNAENLEGAGDKSRVSRSSLSGASLVRNLLKRHPKGLTSKQVASELTKEVSSQASNPRNTITSALYNLRKSGVLQHDATTGIYRLSDKGDL